MQLGLALAGQWGLEVEPLGGARFRDGGAKARAEERGLQVEDLIHQRRSEDQKSAVLVVQKMKILLVWWYGGMIF